MTLIRETPISKRSLRGQRPFVPNPVSWPVRREAMTPTERRRLAQMIGRPFTPKPRRRDSVAIAWSLVLFAFLLAAALGWQARTGGW